MSISLIFFLIGALMLIIEMFTLSFHLIIFSIGFIFTALIGYVAASLFGYEISVFSHLIISSISILASYFVVKKTRLMDKFYNKESKFKNTDIDKPVLLLFETFNPNQNTIKCIYKGTEWIAKIESELDSNELNLHFKQLPKDTLIYANFLKYEGIDIVVRYNK